MQPTKQVQKPFFAQFLESQANETQEQASSWQGTGKLIDSPGNETQKYPSDGDEEWDIIH